MGQVRRQYGSGSIFERADGMWIGRIEVGFDVDGKRRRITVSATTETRCKEKLEAKKMEIARMGVPDKLTGKGVTVKDWSTEWLAQIESHLRPRPYANAVTNVNRWIIPNIGRKRLVKLTPGDVRAVLDEMRKAGRSSSTRTHAHTHMMSMFRAAMVEGHDIPQRVLMVPRPRPDEDDREALARSEAHAVLHAARTRLDVSTWIAAFLQGLRQGERLGLRWDAIDFDANTIDVSWQLQPLPYRVPRDRSSGFRVPDAYVAIHLVDAFHLVRPKTRRSHRLIPMIPIMRQALLAWRDVAPISPHGLVWPDHRGRPRSAKADRTEWIALQDEAGVRHPAGRHYVLHEARHTCATLLREQGTPREIVEAILGHSKLVAAYDHAKHLEGSREAMEQLSRQLGLTPPAAEIAAPIPAMPEPSEQ